MRMVLLGGGQDHRGARQLPGRLGSSGSPHPGEAAPRASQGQASASPVSPQRGQMGRGLCCCEQGLLCRLCFLSGGGREKGRERSILMREKHGGAASCTPSEGPAGGRACALTGDRAVSPRPVPAPLRTPGGLHRAPAPPPCPEPRPQPGISGDEFEEAIGLNKAPGLDRLVSVDRAAGPVLGCSSVGPWPGRGMLGRQPIDVSLSHPRFSLSTPPRPSHSL